MTLFQITSAADIDYEDTETVQFTIKVTDDGIPPGYFEKDISLKITDVNEPPTGLYITQNMVSEINSYLYKIFLVE